MLHHITNVLFHSITQSLLNQYYFPELLWLWLGPQTRTSTDNWSFLLQADDLPVSQLTVSKPWRELKSTDFNDRKSPTAAHSVLIHLVTPDGRDVTSFTPTVWGRPISQLKHLHHVT